MSFMKGDEEEPIFFDANILAYAFDESDAKRKEKCEKLVRAGFQGDFTCHVSNQILGELFMVLTRHSKRPLSKEKAGVIVSGFIDSSRWVKSDYTHQTVKRALLDLETVNTSFWDLLIAETMRDAKVRTIYTENEHDFAKIPWIKIVNPL
jgi:predicted nucleic acid-binding protein